MDDIALKFSLDGIDVSLTSSRDLESDRGLETAVLISLYTDKRVTSEQLPLGETEKQGWWGDVLSEIAGDQIGSRLWTLTRRKRTIETLRLFEEYTKEALDWFIEDGIASSVEVTASYQKPRDNIAVLITLVRPLGDVRFSLLWDEQLKIGDN